MVRKKVGFENSFLFFFYTNNLQRNIADSNIERIENREQNHDHIFMVAKFGRGEDSGKVKGITSYCSTQRMNGGQSPWKAKVVQNSLVE